jgi:hypothetical protein
MFMPAKALPYLAHVPAPARFSPLSGRTDLLLRHFYGQGHNRDRCRGMLGTALETLP